MTTYIYRTSTKPDPARAVRLIAQRGLSPARAAQLCLVTEAGVSAWALSQLLLFEAPAGRHARPRSTGLSLNGR